ncbi:flagellin, partial [Fodinibius saliphilus]|uniref:flagellin n=1 Tax=Fodinibius saliphilus TaxID=1920650 RepID=UPI001108D49D
GTIMDNLVEMKGLATQAANDTLGEDERGFIGEQIKELGADINDISDSTVFQGYDLLSGDDTTATKSGALELTFQVGERASDTITADLNAVNVGELFADGTNTAQLGNSGGDGAVADGSAIEATAAGTAGATNPGGALSFETAAGTAANSSDFRSFISHVDDAITTMSENVNDIGITQSSLSVREETLSQSISANESAKSRIMDTDFAKAQSEKVRLSILQQTATSSLAQANNGPQSVLGFLR